MWGKCSLIKFNNLGTKCEKGLQTKCYFVAFCTLILATHKLKLSPFFFLNWLSPPCHVFLKFALFFISKAEQFLMLFNLYLCLNVYTYIVLITQKTPNVLFAKSVINSNYLFVQLLNFPAKSNIYVHWHLKCLFKIAAFCFNLFLKKKKSLLLLLIN